MMINGLVGCNVCEEGYTLPYHDILTEYIWFVCMKDQYWKRYAEQCGIQR